jgi:protease-4
MVGSIGVIMQRMMVKELMEKIGVQVEPIKSTHMKDIGSPFREMTDSERKYFEHLIGSFHDRFVSIVADGRGLEVEKVRELASGKIYTAQQSLEYGLVDEIGYFSDALDKTAELAGLANPEVIQYKEPFDIESVFKDLPFGKAKSSSQIMQTVMQTAMDMAATPGVDALWHEDIK